MNYLFQFMGGAESHIINRFLSVRNHTVRMPLACQSGGGPHAQRVGRVLCHCGASRVFRALTSRHRLPSPAYQSAEPGGELDLCLSHFRVVINAVIFLS